jgi:uncharacterized OsmC-like protein
MMKSITGRAFLMNSVFCLVGEHTGSLLQLFPDSLVFVAAPTRRTIIPDKEIRMKSEELRSIQSPLKEYYREQPGAALVTLKAQGNIGEGITCKIQTGKALVEAGLHPATGGDGLSVCSGDMLLEALVACAGVTLNAVATAIGVEIRSCTVRAEGDLDFRGTLGVVKDVPVGFQKIRVFFDLDTDASEDQLASLLRLTERYCVVYQTLRQPPEMSISR